MGEEGKKAEDKKERRFSQQEYDKLMQCSEEEKTKIENIGRYLWCNWWQYKLLKVCATDDEGIKKWNEWRKTNKVTNVFLGKAELDEAFLMRANLKGAFLEGAQLRGAFFWEANLQGANLRESDLQNAKLMRTHLQGAEFGGAKLQGADFSRAIVDGYTLIWRCEVDRKTKFEGVSLDVARIYPRTKQLLEYNIRRANWEEWYKWKDWYKHEPKEERNKLSQFFLKYTVGLFWAVSDYGMSTLRVIGVFFILALLFAAVYMNWAYWSPPGVVDDLLVKPAEGEAALHYFGRALIRPIYFSVVTMTTLGFGDMYANKDSIAGHVLLILQVILGYVLLGALITRFAVLFTAGGPAGKFARSRSE